TDQYGWIHAPSPVANYLGQETTFEQGLINYLNSINHNPLDLGDNLPTPANPQGASNADTYQSWWGFPTWRETLSPVWADPTFQINLTTNLAQPPGLSYSPLVNAGTTGISNGRVNALDQNLLPPMAVPGSFTGDFTQFRQTSQLFCDAAGQNSAFWPGGGA